LEGLSAAVTGATGDIGGAIARVLGDQGARVGLIARRAERLEELAEELRDNGIQVCVCTGDVTDPEAVAAAAEAVGEAIGPVDILVNNAGGPPPGDFRDWTLDDWNAALNANMLTAIELIRATVDGMMEREFGRVVNITSAAVKSPIDILGLSNGARAGLTGFVAGIARKTVRRNVTINGLLPGPFDTDRLNGTFAARAKAAWRPAEGRKAEGAAANPAGRFGTAEEFGHACAFLCSAHAGFSTGQNLLMDGGSFPGTL